jgi:hypothetical protein
MSLPSVIRDSAVAAEPQLIATDVFAIAGQSSSVVEWLDHLTNYLTPDSFFKVSTSYSPRFARTLLSHVLPLQENADPKVRASAKRLVRHHAFVMAAVNPDKFIRVVRKLFANESLSARTICLSRSLAYSLSRVGGEAEMRYFPFVHKFVGQMTAEQLDSVPLMIWDIIAETAAAADLIRFLERFSKHERRPLWRAVARFARFKPATVQPFLTLFSIGFVAKIVRYLGDQVPLVLAPALVQAAAIGRDIGHEKFVETCTAFARILGSARELNREETEQFRAIFEFARTTVGRRDLEPRLRLALIRFIQAAARRGWTKKSALLRVTNLQITQSSYSKTMFEIVFDVIKVALSKTQIRDDLIAIAPLATGQAAEALLKQLEVKWRTIVKCNAEFAFELASQFVRPFPAGDSNLALVLHFFNSIPISDLLDARLGLDPTAYFERAAQSVSGAVQTELQVFIGRAGVVVNPGHLDFLSWSGAASFSYANEIDGALLAELLEYGMIDPQALRLALGHIARTSALHAPYFAALVDLLECEVAELGFDIPSIFEALGLPADGTQTEVSWISQVDLHLQFAKIGGGFAESEFGRLLEATLEAIVAAYSYVRTTEVLQSRLAMLVSFVAHVYSCPCTALLGRVHAELDSHWLLLLEVSLLNAIECFRDRNTRRQGVKHVRAWVVSVILLQH